MGILEKLLGELPELDLTTKVRIICDKIIEEEINQIIETEEYKKMSDKDKLKAIKSIKSKAKKLIFNKYNP